MDAGREGLDVTTLICANRSYRIIVTELGRAGGAELGPAARRLTDLREPALDWVRPAEGMGVPGVRVRAAEELAEQLDRAVREPGPHQLELVL